MRSSVLMNVIPTLNFKEGSETFSDSVATVLKSLFSADTAYRSLCSVATCGKSDTEALKCSSVKVTL
jgi:hypothetical protein